MSTFKSRLIAEQSELNEKVDKLSSFVVSDNFDKIDPKQQDLLNKQLPVMQEYNTILKDRINLLQD